MNISDEDCNAWKETPTINPITKRSIMVTGPVYKHFNTICNKLKEVKESKKLEIDGIAKLDKSDCNEWNKDKTRHPITKRKLNISAKNGIYSQLVQLCKDAKSVKLEKSLDIDEKRVKLIDALNHKLVPLLNKADTQKTRITFAEILENYVTNLDPCLQEYNNNLALFKKVTKKDISVKPTIYFEKRIGSESVYGIAYMNMGQGFAKLFKFSCKIMASNIADHKREVKILTAMTKAVKAGKTPNMPLTYKILECKSLCNFKICPAVAKKSYYAVINELATYDLESWFKTKHTEKVYESIIMQIIFGIYAFHKFGYNHNDCHLGNFLIHKIKPGGCWRYSFNGENIYVPNHGYLLVMWDPGLASKYDGNYWNDYYRVLSLIATMDNYKRYKELKLISVPSNIQNKLYDLIHMFYSPFIPENKVIEKALDNIKTNLTTIKVGGTPPDFLLNVKPYTMV